MGELSQGRSIPGEGGGVGEFYPPQRIFKPKNLLKRSILNTFLCVFFFTSNLLLRHLYGFNSLSEKNHATTPGTNMNATVQGWKHE